MYRITTNVVSDTLSTWGDRAQSALVAMRALRQLTMHGSQNATLGGNNYFAWLLCEWHINWAFTCIHFDSVYCSAVHFSVDSEERTAMLDSCLTITCENYSDHSYHCLCTFNVLLSFNFQYFVSINMVFTQTVFWHVVSFLCRAIEGQIVLVIALTSHVYFDNKRHTLDLC